MALLRSNHERLKIRGDWVHGALVTSSALFRKAVLMKSNIQGAESRTVKAILGVFSRHCYLVDLFFENETKDKIRCRPEELKWRSQDMSRAEQVLIRVALDIWSGSGEAKVWELLEVLDEDNFIAVLKALMLVKADRTWPYNQGTGFSL